MSRQTVLGVDGGGTKTHVAIVDDRGRLLGEGEGGPSNYDDVGVDVARQNVKQAVSAARRAAGLGDDPFDAVFLGMAGVVSETDRAAIRSIARDLSLAPPQRVGMDHDCRIALAGGLSGRPGIVQIAGTGSSTFGMNAAGEGWRSGGWGHLLADEGSGYWLGLHAMIAAVRSYDGRLSHTVLQERVQEALDLSDLNDVMHRLYVEGLSRSEIAALGPLVIEAANDGDAHAQALIEQGCAEMADCVLAVARKLGMDDGPSELALVGGLFQAGPIVRRPFAEAVHRRLPRCQVTLAELPPVLGACLLALDLLDVPVAPGLLQTLRAEASRT